MGANFIAVVNNLKNVDLASKIVVWDVNYLTDTIL